MADILHHICSTVGEIEAAVAAVNADGTQGAIGILPGSYNLKSPYRKELEIDPSTATVPSGGTELEDRYALYIGCPNVTLYAVVPGTVRLYGEATAILKTSEATTSEYRVFRGGMLCFDTSAANAKVIGIEFDGAVAVSGTFDIDSYCHRDTTDGADCWDFSHRAIHTVAPNLDIKACKFHNWAGEMIYGGSGSSVCQLNIYDSCSFYNNQVTALAGNWQLRCHDNEFYSLNQVANGVHQYSSMYDANYIHDCDGGINIIGPLTAELPAAGWWVSIQRNLFERCGNSTYGAISLETATGSYEPCQNVGAVDNIFRDCDYAVSVVAGVVSEFAFERNQVILDKATAITAFVSASGSLQDSLIRDNSFVVERNAAVAGYLLTVGALTAGDHSGTRFEKNYYDHATPAFATANSTITFMDEVYKDPVLDTTYQSKTDESPIDDVEIPIGSTGIFGVSFEGAGPLYLRLTTVDGGSAAAFPDGTELRLQGNADDMTTAETAFLIHGRGCRLVDSEPVFLQSTADYVLLRYDAVLKVWVEVERVTARANQTFNLRHHGLAADLPDFASVAALTVSTVNVIDAALEGWEYYETDTGLLKIYTDSGWQTVWTAA